MSSGPILQIRKLESRGKGLIIVARKLGQPRLEIIHPVVRGAEGMGLGPGWAPHFSQRPSPVCSRQVLPQEREVTGTLMTFFLALGLSCGASLSFLFKALL